MGLWLGKQGASVDLHHYMSPGQDTEVLVSAELVLSPSVQRSAGISGCENSGEEKNCLFVIFLFMVLFPFMFVCFCLLGHS